jgi:hypothetical protein
MISNLNYYDSSNIINGISVPLPYKGMYEDLFNYNGFIIETFSNVNDTLYIDFLNSKNLSSDISSTPIITETYTIYPNTPKTIIIQPRLRYYRIRIATPSYNSITDNRKYIIRLINTNILPNKIYGSENMPICTDASGNISLPSLETLIEETNTILDNLSVSVDLSGASIAVDMSGTDLILTNIYNDVSGLPSSLDLIQNDISGGFMLLHQDLQNLDISGGSIDMSGTNLILTQIHNDVSGITTGFNLIHNDVSGIDNHLDNIHNDVSGITTGFNLIHNDVSGVDNHLDNIHNDVSGITTGFNLIHNDVSGVDNHLDNIHNDVSGITTISTQIHNDVSGITTGFNLIHNDISGTNYLLAELLDATGSLDISGTFNFDLSGVIYGFSVLHNDVSGFRYDSSNNLFISDMSNFTVNTAQNKTKSQFINIIADNGGIVLNGLDGCRDFVYGSEDVSGAFYIFNSIQNNIILSSSSGSDTSTYSILITGLDNTYSIISETLNLNGTGQVMSSNQYFRLNSFEVITSPMGNLTFANPLNGNITITDASSNNFGIIDYISGKRLAGVYTVPASHKFLITKLELSEETTQNGTLFLYTRNITSSNKRFILLAKYYFSNGGREINMDMNPLVLNEKTDLLLRVKTDGNAYCILSGILTV